MMSRCSWLALPGTSSGATSRRPHAACLDYKFLSPALDTRKRLSACGSEEIKPYFRGSVHLKGRSGELSSISYLGICRNSNALPISNILTNGPNIFFQPIKL